MLLLLLVSVLLLVPVLLLVDVAAEEEEDDDVAVAEDCEVPARSTVLTGQELLWVYDASGVVGPTLIV